MLTLKHFKSIILTTIITATAISSVSCGDWRGVTGRGSSSVFPILEMLEDNGYELSYKVSGSGDGFNSQSKEKPESDFGMTSSKKTPKSKIGKMAEWVNPNIRTVTFAIDAIVVAMHFPDGLKTLNNANPIISGKKVAMLFDEDLNNDPTWGQLLENEDPNSNGITDKPFVLGRDGGKSKSGTADGFFHTLKKFADGLKIDINHSKLSASHKTKEPNSSAYQSLKSRKGSLTYLSLGFALANNQDKSGKKNFLKVAKIKTNTNYIWDPEQVDTYGWKRPFNIIYSVRNETTIKFVENILSPKIQAKIKERGFIPLNSTQLDMQTKKYKTKKISLSSTDKYINEITTLSNIDDVNSLYFGVNL